MNKMIYHINKNSFHNILYSYPIVVVNVSAPWCKPCNVIFPKYIELSKNYTIEHNAKKIIFLKDDITKKDSVHSVKKIPIFFIYIRGQKYDVHGFDNLKRTIDDALWKLIITKKL